MGPLPDSAKVKGRYVVALLLFSFFLLPDLLALLWTGEDADWYWIDLGYIYAAQLTGVAFIVLVSRLLRLDLRALLGRWPTAADWRLLLHVDLLLFGLSMALLYAIYIPFSYLSPDFVAWWLDWLYAPVVYLAADGSLPLLANGLSLVSLAVLAPLGEEILFRGFLLRRWAMKWGMRPAIIASSVVFGLLHPDPLGAALFGAAMCLLYLHTRTLWVPILAHALYNGVIWAWDLVYAVELGFDYYLYDLEQFRDDWRYGVGGALVALVAAALFLRSGSAAAPAGEETRA